MDRITYEERICKCDWWTSHAWLIHAFASIPYLWIVPASYASFVALIASRHPATRKEFIPLWTTAIFLFLFSVFNVLAKDNSLFIVPAFIFLLTYIFA